jgi:S1-C subfamily serine protease
MKGKTLKIVGIALVGLVVLGAAAFFGSQYVFAQVQPDTQNLLGMVVNQVATPAAPGTGDTGLVVVIVNANGPAAAAGVKRGDILLKINDTAVNTLADLKNVLKTVKAGDVLNLTVMHGDNQETLKLTVGNNNGNPDLGLVPFGGGMRGGGRFGFGKEAAGAAITSVDANSPASQAGLKQGDRILAVDGTNLGPNSTLATLLASHKSGDKVVLHIMSGTTASDVTVTLGDKNGKAYLGIQYNEYDRGQFAPGKQFSLPQGVTSGLFVSKVVAGSPAEKAGLQVHDVITKLDGTAVTTADAFVQALAAKKPGDSVTVTVYHMNSQTSVDIKVALGDNPQQAGKAYMGVSLFDLGQFHSGAGGNGGSSGGNGNNGSSGFPFPGRPFRQPSAPAITGNNA